MPTRSLVLGAQGVTRNHLLQALLPINEKVHVITMQDYADYKSILTTCALAIKPETKVLVFDGLDKELTGTHQELVALYNLVSFAGSWWGYQLDRIIYVSSNFDVFRCLEIHEAKARFVFDHVYIPKSEENKKYLAGYQSFVRRRMNELSTQAFRSFERGLANTVLCMDDSFKGTLTVFNVLEVCRLFKV